MDIFSMIAESKIREAMENGDLDHLKGKGKPLKMDNLSGVPKDLRMAYKILKNSGYVPEEVQLKKEILSLEDLISCCDDEEKIASLHKKLTEKTLRYNQLMEQRSLMKSQAYYAYKDKIADKFKL
ncbi:hypothetical protein JOD45_002200 [Scopulibacillus daqui]|uniref:DnaJ homologue subfamily C member 28 conserved domain-containing protein n=1 Tax=Scopulibacillus daqui TaxID=1469162 RepID=A0ABS2Q296_9BACL|nr:DUF1992 domain-containing protein [Scopulibacillus daqui]MBM7645975.1 hypothetical protein [Scopulibacillus daqui]